MGGEISIIVYSFIGELFLHLYLLFLSCFPLLSSYYCAKGGERGGVEPLVSMVVVFLFWFVKWSSSLWSLSPSCLGLHNNDGKFNSLSLLSSSCCFDL
jgi:hypothetical protein